MTEGERSLGRGGGLGGEGVGTVLRVYERARVKVTRCKTTGCRRNIALAFQRPPSVIASSRASPLQVRCFTVSTQPNRRKRGRSTTIQGWGEFGWGRALWSKTTGYFGAKLQSILEQNYTRKKQNTKKERNKINQNVVYPTGRTLVGTCGADCSPTSALPRLSVRPSPVMFGGRVTLPDLTASAGSIKVLSASSPPNSR